MRRILLPIVTFLVAWAILAAGIYYFTQGNTLGSDFLLFYRAGQTSMIDHADPYTDQQALLNQLAIFKHPSAPGEDQLGFAYPPYALLIVWPVLWLNFAWAQAVWAAFLVLSVVAMILLAAKDAPPWVSISFLFFYPVTFGLILGNFAVLMGGMILLTFGIMYRNQPASRVLQITLGILMAWLTSKPQFTWLFIILFLFWALKKRWWTFIFSFGISLLAFVAISFAITPNWPSLWLDRISKYTGYNQTWLILTVFLKEFLPLFVAELITVVFAVVILAITGWLFYVWWNGRLDDLYLLAWCGFVTYSLHPRGASYEQIIFLLPMVAWAWREKRLLSPAVLVFWMGSIIVSWAAFFLSIQPNALTSTTEWPLLFYIVWLGWLFYKRRASRLLPAAG